MPILYYPSGTADPDAVQTALEQLPVGAPVIVMIHGFKYQPSAPGHCPFSQILSLAPTATGKRTISWPKHLGAGRSGADAPLCISFGWPARGSIWKAWKGAALAGADLARLLDYVNARRNSPAQIIAHSLGARVALRGVSAASQGSAGRIVLLSGAVLRPEACAALNSPAGTDAHVLNVTSRANRLFDHLLEAALLRPGGSIGTGLGVVHPRWMDLNIDDGETRTALRALGHPIGRPDIRICHWSVYMRPGLFPLYRRILGAGRPICLKDLRAALPGPRPAADGTTDPKAGGGRPHTRSRI